MYALKCTARHAAIKRSVRHVVSLLRAKTAMKARVHRQHFCQWVAGVMLCLAAAHARFAFSSYVRVQQPSLRTLTYAGVNLLAY